MEIQKGSVVYSKAGRDKKKLLLVLRTDGEFAYVADGILRTADKPKKKKLKHLQGTKWMCKVFTDMADSDIRKALSEYKSDN